MQEPLSASRPPGEESSAPWLAIGIGAVLIAMVVAAVAFFGRGQQPSPAGGAPPPQPPYARSLMLGDLRMSAAETFVGGTVNYFEGKITNQGDKVVTGAGVEAIFRNSLDQVVQRERQPLMVILTRAPAIDLGRLSAAPLKPGDTREFRLSLEHISADWNHQYPELRIISVTTQ